MIAHSRHTRYRHKKDYTFYDADGKEVAVLKVDVKLPSEYLRSELKKFAQECDAVTCYITWTALQGNVKEKVEI